MGSKKILTEPRSSASLSDTPILDLVTLSLDADKALDPVVIDLRGKTTIADAMVVATGTSQRHLAAMSDKLLERLKRAGFAEVAAEGRNESDWVLIDAGDVIVHLFREEARGFYQLEKLWTMTPATEAAPRAVA